MPTRLFWRDTGTAPNWDLSEAVGTAATVNVTTPNNDTFAAVGSWRVTVGDTVTGTSFPTSFVITARGNGVVRIRVSRANSGGTIQASSDWGAERLTVATFTETFTLSTTWAAGDQLVVEMQGRRAAGTHSTDTVTIGVNREASHVDATITASLEQTIQAGTTASQETVPSPEVVLAAESLSISPTAIPSAEAFSSIVTFGAETVMYGAETVYYGLPTLSQEGGDLFISPSAFGSTEIFGNPTLSSDLILVVGGVASLEVVSTPAVSVGDLSISPASLASEEVLGVTSVIPGVRSLATVSILTQEAFGDSTLLNTQVVVVDGVASLEAVSAPVLSVSGVSITSTSIVSEETLGDTSVIPGVRTLTTVSILSEETFGQHSLANRQFVGTNEIVSLEIVTTPTMIAGGVLVGTQAIPSGEALGSALVQPGVRVVDPVSLQSQEVFGVSSVIPGTVFTLPLGIGSVEQWGDIWVSVGASFLQPQAIGSGEVFATPEIVGHLQVSPLGLSSLEAFGVLSLAALQTILPPSILTVTPVMYGEDIVMYGDEIVTYSSDLVGTPTIFQDSSFVGPTAILSGETLGSVIVLSGQVGVTPSGITSHEILSIPDVLPGGISTSPSGIVSLETVSNPVLQTTVLGQLIEAFGISSIQVVSSPLVFPGEVLVLPDSIASALWFGVTRILREGDEAPGRRRLWVGIPRVRFKEEK